MMTHSHKSEFDLGDMVRERLTGISGRVTGICFYETGCTHIGISRLGVSDDGKPYDHVWFDEPKIELLSDDLQRPDLAPGFPEKPGGPLPTGMSYPGAR